VSERFNELDELTNHEKKLHPKQCRNCSLKFRTETELEDHIYAQHDVFNQDEDKKHDLHKLRVDSQGQFKLPQNIATQRFAHNHSKWRQKQRMLQQMTRIKKRVIVNKQNKKRVNKNKQRVNTQSFLDLKRSNIGNTMSWKKEETERFYKILKYTGLNFVFMEVLYNKAIPKKEGGQNEDAMAILSDSDSAIDDKTDSKKKKKKKKEKKAKQWRYRDAKSLKKKYQKETVKNSQRITDIARNAKFAKQISDKIGELAKKNNFKLKDEQYFEHSDIEQNVEDKTNENEFNPFSAFKDEIEKDRKYQKNMKMKNDEKLEIFRKKRQREMALQSIKFKAEQKEYQLLKEESLRSHGGAENGDNGHIVNQQREQNERNRNNVMVDNEHINNDNLSKEQVVENENDLLFNPFDIMVESDDEYVDDQTLNDRRNNTQSFESEDEIDFDNEDVEDIDNFDFDRDPFEN